MSGAHGHGHIEAEGNNRKIALLIAVLALFLALAETMAKGAQTNALSYSVEASNLWSFFQAETVRQHVLPEGAVHLGGGDAQGGRGGDAHDCLLRDSSREGRRGLAGGWT